MTQQDQILDYMKAGNSLTSWECIHKFGYTRLAALKHKLKRMGYTFETETLVNNGKKFAKYKLVGQMKLEI